MEDNRKVTVCAVVVTFNRKKLLGECLDALLRQTRPLASIIIIDNASTDGTEGFLWENYLHNPVFEYVRLPENTGGSGGFHEGMKKAYEKGFDWLWLMDDDVVPEGRSLESLLSISSAVPSNVGFMCSRVKGINGQSLNVPMIDNRLGENGYPQWDVLLDLGLLKVRSTTFVSVLIHRRVIRSVGLPIRKFFIWGDDSEFTMRITQSMPGYMVGASTVIHKRAVQAAIELDTETEVTRIKYFFFRYRNWLYIIRKYSGKKSAAFFLVRSGPQMLLRILRARTYRLLRIRTLFAGLVAGLFFNPKVEYPEP